MKEFFFLFFVTFVVVYLVYGSTLFPSVPGGDSGELLAESCLLGVVHPPGYPLLTMLAHIVGQISLPRFYLSEDFQLTLEFPTTIAWRINHLCCIFGALSASFISLSIFTILKRYQYLCQFGPSILGAFLFAFSPVVWEHSIGAEVFSLNNLLCSMLLYLTIIISHSLPSSLVFVHSKSNSNSLYLYVLLGAFISGLTLSNQHASLLLLIVLIPFILFITYPYSMTLPYLLSISLVFSLAISSYFYLFFTAFHPSLGSWGDTTSFYGLLRHVLRSEYGTFQLGVREGTESSLERVYLYLIHSLSNGYYLNLPLSLMGLGVFFFQHPLHFTNADRRKKNKLIKNKAIKEKSEIDKAASQELTVVGSERGSTRVTKRAGKKTGKNESEKNDGSETVEDNMNKNDNEIQASSSSTSPPVEIFCLMVAWAVYVSIWHGVLSNIPLNSPMPYGVHARFWMQPDLIISILTGTGFGVLLSVFTIRVPSLVSNFIQFSIVSSFFIWLMVDRYPYLDRSSSGYVMHHYGLHILDSISRYPQQQIGSQSDHAEILLFSHTDLNWNTVRYLQSCEGINSPKELKSRTNWTTPHFPLLETETRHVIHLNFQLIPFPWFEKQQAPLYPTVIFPPLFKGVSTNRMSKENSLLIQRILVANLRPNRYLFLDMQAINDAEIGNGGSWVGSQGQFLLIPFGMVYRVEKMTTLKDSSLFHQESLFQLFSLRSSFPFLSEPNSPLLELYSHHATNQKSQSPIFFSAKNPFSHSSLPFREKFPPGTWEHAVVATYHDAHNQFALNLLSYSIEMQKSARTYSLFLQLIDRYTLSASILMTTLHSIIYYCTASPSSPSPLSFYPFSLNASSSPSIASLSAVAPLSTPLIDLLKNTALSMMRLEAIMRITQDESLVPKLFNDLNNGITDRTLLLTHDFVERILAQGEEFQAVREKTIRTIEWFLEEKGYDKDAEVFRSYLHSLRMLMEAEDD